MYTLTSFTMHPGSLMPTLIYITMCTRLVCFNPVHHSIAKVSSQNFGQFGRSMLLHYSSLPGSLYIVINFVANVLSFLNSAMPS